MKERERERESLVFFLTRLAKKSAETKKDVFISFLFLHTRDQSTGVIARALLENELKKERKDKGPRRFSFFCSPAADGFCLHPRAGAVDDTRGKGERRRRERSLFFSLFACISFSI